MKLVAPMYYSRFCCKGGACKNNCCIGWEIDIDSATMAKYSALGGEMGERLSHSIDLSGEMPHFCLADGDRCLHLNGENLCDIIINLGEGYLCDICREHPRYYLTLGDTVYSGVGLSCEAAAELIICDKNSHGYGVIPAEGFSYEECDEDLHTLVLSWRERLVKDICEARSFAEALSVCCDGALSLQGDIDGEKIELSATMCHEKCGFSAEITRLFSNLEYMGDDLLPKIRKSLSHMSCGYITDEDTSREVKNILLYYIDRYLMGAVCDGDALGAVFLAMLSASVIAMMASGEGELLPAAVLYSAEIEYSEDNVEAIKAAAYPELMLTLVELLK